METDCNLQSFYSVFSGETVTSMLFREENNAFLKKKKKRGSWKLFLSRKLHFTLRLVWKWWSKPWQFWIFFVKQMTYRNFWSWIYIFFFFFSSSFWQPIHFFFTKVEDSFFFNIFCEKKNRSNDFENWLQFTVIVQCDFGWNRDFDAV